MIFVGKMKGMYQQKQKKNGVKRKLFGAVNKCTKLVGRGGKVCVCV